MVDDENLIYRSPSELSNLISHEELDFNNFIEDDLDRPGPLELPLTGSNDLLSPEDGSITRYANIFDEVDAQESDDDDFDTFRKESYSDTGTYGRSDTSTPFNNIKDSYFGSAYRDDDTRSERSLTFSDRVVQERQRMIRKKMLSESRAAERPLIFKRPALKRVPRPHQIECSFSFEKYHESQDQLDHESTERHKKIDDLLKAQHESIAELRVNSRKTTTNNSENVISVQQENARLLAESAETYETIKSLKIEIENTQSDLVVERKQNEQLLRDKVELQNRINLLAKENKSLLASQDMMQSIHKNEIDELKTKRLELTGKIAKLEKDLDYFRDNLQESHKMNEMLKTEIASLNDMYKNDRKCLQKLKTDNKRLMETNSLYKSQNYSLIEINDRLRTRTLFRNHSGDLTTSNSSTVTNTSSTICFPPDSPASTITAVSNGGFSTLNSSPKFNSKDVAFDSMTRTSESTDACPEDHLTLSKVPEVLEILNSVQNSPQSPLSDRDRLFSRINGHGAADQQAPQQNSPSSSSDPDSPANSPPIAPPRHSNFGNEKYDIVRIIREDRLANPTIKWVVDRVSRNSTVDGLESLREKIRNITSSCSVENVNIDPSLNCFQSNVTINLIQNKLQLISQRLHQTTA